MKRRFILLFLIVLSSRIVLHAQADTSGIIIDPLISIPEFPGGDKAFSEFLKKNIQYPERAKKDSVQGTVYIQFAVDTNVLLHDFVVRKGVKDYPEFEAEAIRVLKLSPPWKPAGTKVLMTQPVRFILPSVKPVQPCYCGKCIPEDSLTGLVKFAEQMPQYPGGDGAMMKFIGTEVKLKPYSRNHPIKTSFYIRYIVLEDGSLVNIVPAREIDSDDPNTQAVIEAFCKMPRWNPAVSGGQKVKCEIQQRIILDLQ